MYDLLDNKQVNYGMFEDTLTKVRQLHEQLNTMLANEPEERPVILSPESAAGLVQMLMQNLEQEELWVIVLDTRNRVIRIVPLYKCTLDSSKVRVGEIFKAAIRLNAATIIMVHNHPSGDPAPSPDDVLVTKSIVEGGKILEIDVLDHLVIGYGRFVSMKARGLF